MWDFKRILVGVDFSEPSKKTLIYADKLAKKIGSRLDVLYVMKNPAGVFVPYSPMMFNLGQSDIERAKERLKGFVADLNLSFSEEAIHVALGRPAETIVSKAKELMADLIVLGAKGRGLLLPVGTVTERVLRTAPCPVIAYKEPHAEQKNPGV